jgi:hypothetical protein
MEHAGTISSKFPWSCTHNMQILQCHSFLWLSNIPLYAHITVHSSADGRSPLFPSGCGYTVLPLYTYLISTG